LPDVLLSEDAKAVINPESVILLKFGVSGINSMPDLRIKAATLMDAFMFMPVALNDVLKLKVFADLVF